MLPGRDARRRRALRRGLPLALALLAAVAAGAAGERAGFTARRRPEPHALPQRGVRGWHSRRPEPLHERLRSWAGLRARGARPHHVRAAGSAREPGPRPDESRPVDRQLVDPAAARDRCSFEAHGPVQRKLLQVNGSADDVVHVVLCPGGGVDLAATRLVETSSNDDVLSAGIASPSDVHTDSVVSQASGCRNMTLSFAFEKFVGTTVYKLAARGRATAAAAAAAAAAAEGDLCSVTLYFLVAGMTIYSEEPLTDAGAPGDAPAAANGGAVVYAEANPPGTRRVIHSGVNGGYSNNYEAALNSPLFMARVRVQYPDGGTAVSTTAAALHATLLSLAVRARHGNETIPTPYNEVACKPVALQQTREAAPPQLQDEECGIAFGELVDPGNSSADGRGEDKLVFGVRLDPYRVGVSKMTLVWDGFSAGDPDLEDELYSTTLDVSVTGRPPPIVTSIQDPGPLFRSGGSEVHVVMANTEGSASRQLLVGGRVFAETPRSYRSLGDGLQSATFVAAPGNGTSLRWTLRVAYPDGGVKESDQITSSRADLLHYEDGALRLSSIEPPSARAGQKISLVGYFDGFDVGDMAAPGYGLFFDNASIALNPGSTEIDGGSSRIQFVLPPREEAGSSYGYDVRVLVAGQYTNAARFTYAPGGDENRPVITVFGSSFNSSTRRYEIGSCGSSRYSVSVAQGVPAPEAITWYLREAEGNPSAGGGGRENLLDAQTQIQDKRALLVLPQSAFPSRTGVFEVSVRVAVLGKELTALVLVDKLDLPVIGVQIFKPPARGLSVPNAPLRISSYVDVPEPGECFNGSARVIYDWTVGSEAKRFSFANFTETSMANESMPARLGREYVIPTTRLEYGDLNVSLFVFMEDEPAISGRSEMTVAIEPPALVALIGNGEIQVATSVAAAYKMTGEKSFDPDSVNLGLGDSGIDVYKWTCDLSVDAGGAAGTTPCGLGLIPDPNASTFLLEKAALIATRDAIAARDGTGGQFFVHYTLAVGKDFRLSPKARQTLRVEPDPFEVARLSDISVTDNQGNPIDWGSVKYYEGVLIVPVGEDVSWKISVLEPVQERNTLLTGAGVILRPGYYDPSSLDAAQPFPLGLTANALSPGTTYVFEISSFDSRPGVEQGVSTVSLTMLQRPQLVFPALPIVFGDARTLFVASASVNLDKAYAFSYYFYLVDSDGEEFCVDGCSGSPVVQFFVEHEGEYTVRCQLVDMLGKSTLDVAVNEETIMVSEGGDGDLSDPMVRALSGGEQSGASIASYAARIQDLHWAGDHGNLELLVSTMAAQLSKLEVAASSESDFGTLDSAVKSMHQVMVNSAPSTRASQNYVRTASRLASVNSVYFATEEVMYTVLSMVNDAVTKVPATESFQFEDDLQMFYNRSIRHVLAAFTGFTARVRLQQFGSGTGLDARSLVIDTFRLQGDHMIQSVAKGAECGMTKTMSTIVKGGVEARAVDSQMASAEAARARLLQRRSGTSLDATSINDQSLSSQYAGRGEGSSYSHTTLTLAVLCNKEQGSALVGETTEFRWCDAVFDSPGAVRAQSSVYRTDPKSRVVFSLMETIDYIWLSGLGFEQKPSDTQFLITTNVTRLDSGNVLRPVTIADRGCFKVNTTVNRLGVSPNGGCLSVAGFSIASLQVPFEPKVMLKDYQRNGSTVDTAMARDMSSTIEITSSETGIFGAQGVGCPTRVEPAAFERPPNESNIVAYTLGGIGVIVAVGTALTWVSANAFFSRAAPV